MMPGRSLGNKEKGRSLKMAEGAHAKVTGRGNMRRLRDDMTLTAEEGA